MFDSLIGYLVAVGINTTLFSYTHGRLVPRVSLFNRCKLCTCTIEGQKNGIEKSKEKRKEQGEVLGVGADLMYDSIISHVETSVCLEARGEGTGDVVGSDTVGVLRLQRRGSLLDMCAHTHAHTHTRARTNEGNILKEPDPLLW